MKVETTPNFPEEEIRYSEPYRCGIPGRYFYLQSRLMNFKEKIEGKRYVDSEFISDWVQYK
jgi:hypothetical protein